MLKIPWVFSEYLLQLVCSVRTLRRSTCLCLWFRLEVSPDREQDPLHWLVDGTRSVRICPMLAVVSLGHFWRKEGGSHIQVHSFSCGPDWFPLWFLVFWFHFGDLPGPRHAGHSPSTGGQQGGPKLYLLFTLKAGCACVNIRPSRNRVRSPNKNSKWNLNIL